MTLEEASKPQHRVDLDRRIASTDPMKLSPLGLLVLAALIVCLATLLLNSRPRKGELHAEVASAEPPIEGSSRSGSRKASLDTTSRVALQAEPGGEARSEEADVEQDSPLQRSLFRGHIAQEDGLSLVFGQVVISRVDQLGSADLHVAVDEMGEFEAYLAQGNYRIAVDTTCEVTPSTFSFFGEPVVQSFLVDSRGISVLWVGEGEIQSVEFFVTSTENTDYTKRSVVLEPAQDNMFHFNWCLPGDVHITAQTTEGPFHAEVPYASQVSSQTVYLPDDAREDAGARLELRISAPDDVRRLRMNLRKPGSRKPHRSGLVSLTTPSHLIDDLEPGSFIVELFPLGGGFAVAAEVDVEVSVGSQTVVSIAIERGGWIELKNDIQGCNLSAYLLSPDVNAEERLDFTRIDSDGVTLTRSMAQPGTSVLSLGGHGIPPGSYRLLGRCRSTSEIVGDDSIIVLAGEGTFVAW